MNGPNLRSTTQTIVLLDSASGDLIRESGRGIREGGIGVTLPALAHTCQGNRSDVVMWAKLTFLSV
jgi:hypothetical protein